MIYEYASGLVKLKSDSHLAVQEWCNAAHARMHEVALANKEDDVRIESWFTVEICGERYLLWYLRAKSIEHVLGAMHRLERPIDQFHFNFMTQITAGTIRAEPLIDLRCD